MPVLASLPSAAAGPSRPPEAAESASSPAVSELVRQLEANSKNVAEAFTEELQHFRELALEDWPLPVGYQQRLAPAYLASIYRQGRRGIEHAKEFRRSHGLEECLATQELETVLGNMDRMLLIDREPGFLNRVSTEYAARRAFGLEQAFRCCQRREDWLRPKNAPSSWRSKVDWEALDRLDPTAAASLPSQFRAVENEMRGEIERDALMAKAKGKLKDATSGGSGVNADRLNVS